jgi:carbonic anhydrase/acetyltransferase-like protein (isoleucine patch superfamily)
MTFANNALLGGYVEIHDRVFIGGGSVVHQFTRMGAVSLLQGISGIGKDIPPFSIAIGKNSVAALNVIGLRRAGFNQALRSEVKSAFELLYRSGLNVKQALEAAEKRTWTPETMTFWNFVATANEASARWHGGKRSVSGVTQNQPVKIGAAWRPRPSMLGKIGFTSSTRLSRNCRSCLSLSSRISLALSIRETCSKREAPRCWSRIASLSRIIPRLSLVSWVIFVPFVVSFSFLFFVSIPRCEGTPRLLAL